MENQEPKNCWEFMSCKEEVRKDCPAFQGDAGQDCWFIAGSYNPNPECPKAKIKKDKDVYNSCFECWWYKKFNK